MSIPIELNFANADPDVPFTTINELIALFRTISTAEIPEDLTPYIVGSVTPSIDDQDKIWHKTDGAGRPLGTYKFYSGAWRREYTGIFGEVRQFLGDPTLEFDANGKGNVGGNWDGWQIMNGLNGTANLSNKFIVGGNMDNDGFTGFSSGAWRTDLTGTPAQTGGASTVTLTEDTTYQPAKSAVTAAHYTADGNTRDATGGIWGKDAGDGTGAPFDLVAADTGNTSPDPINITPPFFAVCYVQFVGYA